MDNRARASLTYRILTDVLGVTLVFGAYSLSTIAYNEISTLVSNVALYALVFVVLITIWRRLGSMFDLGILGGKVSALIGMTIALSIALAPVFLGIFISPHEAVHRFAADWLAVNFGLIMLLMMFLVRRSHAYKSKTHWRLVHHALLIAGALFLLSALIPLSFARVAEIPGRFWLWLLALAATPILQRVGSGMVANPASPQRASTSTPATSSTSNAATVMSSSSHSAEPAGEEREGQEQHRRPPRRGGGGGRGRFHRHTGPSRRRM